MKKNLYHVDVRLILPTLIMKEKNIKVVPDTLTYKTQAVLALYFYLICIMVCYRIYLHL